MLGPWAAARPAPRARSSGGARTPRCGGGRVAIVAPASAAPNAADDAADWLLSRGYQPRIMPAARSRLDTPFDYLAGTDAERAPTCTRPSLPPISMPSGAWGGFGSWRLLDLLDYELLRRHAKPFIGYSDITALHLAIQRHAGFVTFHGPMLAQDLLNGREEPTESALYAMVGGRMGQGAWIGAPDYALPTTLMPGTATGRLAGGNLALICAMQGSRHEIDTRDAILFIEDVNEAVPRVDRMLSQLAAAGKFESIRACWRAVSHAQRARRCAVPVRVPSLLRERFGPLGIPVLAGWPSGHGDPNRRCRWARGSRWTRRGRACGWSRRSRVEPRAPLPMHDHFIDI